MGPDGESATCVETYIEANSMIAAIIFRVADLSIGLPVKPMKEEEQDPEHGYLKDHHLRSTFPEVWSRGEVLSYLLSTWRLPRNGCGIRVQGPCIVAF